MEDLRALGMALLLIPGIPLVFFLVCSSGCLTLRAPCTVQRLVCSGFPPKGKKFSFVPGQVYLSDWFFASLEKKIVFQM